MPVDEASRLYTDAMTTKAASPHAEGTAPAPTLRAESEAIYAAGAAGVLGAIYGLILSFDRP